MATPNAPRPDAPAFLHDMQIPELARDSVLIIPEALEAELMRVPGDLAYWGAQAADAQMKAAVAKLDRDQKAAELDQMMRSRSIEEGVKFTEKGIESKVLLHPEMREAELKYIEAECDASRLRAFENGVRAKRDMVLSEARRQLAEKYTTDSLKAGQRSGFADGEGRRE